MAEKILHMGEQFPEGKYWAKDTPVLDPRYGGQQGLLPRIGGIDGDKVYPEWMNEQLYLPMDVIPVVLSVPKVLDYLPHPEIWKAAAKALFEVHAKNIDGLDSSLTVETASKPLGLSGANLKTPAKVTRAETNITITADEREGRFIELLIDIVMRYGMEDPDMGIPLIGKLVDSNNIPEIYSPSLYSWTVLFIEPDRFGKRATHAWLVSNLFPESNPNITGKKDKTAAKAMITKQIPMGGFALPPTNRRVMELANKVLSNFELWTKDPEDIILPADKVDAAIAEMNDVAIYYDGVKPGTNSDADGKSGSATG